jgi:hypothetical protein
VGGDEVAGNAGGKGGGEGVSGGYEMSQSLVKKPGPHLLSALNRDFYSIGAAGSGEEISGNSRK